MIPRWVPAWRYSQGIQRARTKPASLFTIHFAVVKRFEDLVNYFHLNPDRRYADSTWCVGQNGEWTQMVKVEDTPWTNGSGMGVWTDENGDLTPLINDIALTVETSNDLDESGKRWVYTDKHYYTLAGLFTWALRNLPHTKVWRVNGHDNMLNGQANWPGTNTPAVKVDPGPLFDWEKFLVGFMRVRSEFFNDYMKFLVDAQECWMGSWSGSPSSDDLLKRHKISLEGAKRLARDLAGKNSSFAIQ